MSRTAPESVDRAFGAGRMARRTGEHTDATALPSGPYVDWYETWLLQHGRRAQAEAAARARAERQERWLIRIFIGWAVVVTGATFASIWWML